MSEDRGAGGEGGTGYRRFRACGVPGVCGERHRPVSLRAEDLWCVFRFFRGPSAMAGRLQGNCLAGVTTLWWPREQHCLAPLRVRVHLGQGGRCVVSTSGTVVIARHIL